MKNDTMTRRAASEWLAKIGGAAMGAGVLAGIAGCATSQPAARPRRTTTTQTVSTPRARSAPPPKLDTPGSKALERWRRARREAPLPSHVVPRSAWASAGPIARRANPMGRVTRITVHHDGMSAFNSTTQTSAMRRIENIRRAHVGSEQWADIGYHYVIDPAGRVYEARPITLQGAHVKYNNEGNLGVMVLGNYNKQAPTPAAKQALDRFVTDSARAHRVPASRIYTHQELRPTACPGRSLQKHMVDARARRGAIALALA